MKKSSPSWSSLHVAVRIALLAAAVAAASCRPAPRELAVVSGKTVYKGMGLENAQVHVFRWEPLGWRHYTDTASGYHGSFLFYAPQGRYRLAADTTVKLQTDEIRLEGTLERLEIGASVRRVDRVVVQLREAVADDR